MSRLAHWDRKIIWNLGFQKLEIGNPKKKVRGEVKSIRCYTWVYNG